VKILVHDYAGHAFPVQLSRALAARGHDVLHAWAANLLTPRGGLERRAGDARLRLGEVPMPERYREVKYNFAARRRLERAYGRELQGLLDRERPDVVLSGNTPTEAQWALVARARARRIPVVGWIQDFYSLAVERLAGRKLPGIGRLAGWWYRVLDRRCLAGCSGVVAITEDFLPLLARFGVPRGKAAVIPNWAPLEDLPARPRINGWSVAHRLGGGFVFLYSGTLAMKHDPSLLVGLAEQFRSDPAVKVVVVSEGPGADYLAARRAALRLDNVVLLPFQPFTALPDVLGAADALVAVLEEDAGGCSVPSKVLAYMCAQRAVLAAIPCENLAARLVRETGAGLVVRPGDRAGFGEAAGRLRADAAAREAMGRRARAWAESAFDIERITDQFEQVLWRAAGGRSGAEGAGERAQGKARA
jgi:glycosyltransferase involved in cell wall biosynthesis